LASLSCVTVSCALSLHDALPISSQPCRQHGPQVSTSDRNTCSGCPHEPATRPTQYDQKQHSSQHEQPSQQAQQTPVSQQAQPSPDRKSTRLNSSHVSISYAVFCL